MPKKWWLKVDGSELISVILPTYNRENSIKVAIDSVLSQTYSNIELIIVDDASTDNTKDIVMSIKDSRIRYIRHEKNKGAAAARNTGIKASKGLYIAFQDSDDKWLPRKLEKQVDLILNTPDRVGAVFSSFIRVGLNQSEKVVPEISNRKSIQGNIFQNMLKENIIGVPAIMIKKNCFKKVGYFNENLPALEDWELFLRISKYYDLLFIDEPLVRTFESPNSVSKNMKSHAIALQYILKTNFNDIAKNKDLLAYYYYKIGKYHIGGHEPELSREWLVKAIRTNPKNLSLVLKSLIFLTGKGLYLNPTIKKLYKKLTSITK